MYPINFLYQNVTGQFEQTYNGFSDLLKQLVSDDIVDKEMVNSSSLEFDSPKTAFGKIILNIPFESAVWCFCYYFYVLHDFYIVPHYTNVDKEDKHIVEIGEKLKDWGLLLKKEYSNWPEGYPVPEDHDKCDIVNHVNQIYLYAMDFVLCHELAHIILGHKNSSIKNEYDADKWAIDTILKGLNGTKDSLILIGLVMGLASLLLLSPSESNSLTHPSSIDRIEQLVSIMKLPEDSPLWCLLAFVIIEWNKEFKKGYDFPQESETFKSLYEEIIKIIKS